jgi:hypothetical protein
MKYARCGFYSVCGRVFCLLFCRGGKRRSAALGQTAWALSVPQHDSRRKPPAAQFLGFTAAQKITVIVEMTSPKK